MPKGPEGGEGLYNEHGQVNDPEIARGMADIEKPYRENKFLGIFKPSESEIRMGEWHAEEYGEAVQSERIVDDFVIQSSDSGWGILGSINGHHVEFDLMPGQKFEPTLFKILIDGNLLDRGSAEMIYSKYKDALYNKFKDQFNNERRKKIADKEQREEENKKRLSSLVDDVMRR